MRLNALGDWSRVTCQVEAQRLRGTGIKSQAKKTSQLREAVDLYPAIYMASSIVLPCLR